MKKNTRPNLILFTITSLLVLFTISNFLRERKIFNGSKISYAASNTFNSSGTWVAPEGIFSARVECWGGGGGGGGSVRRQTYSGGGGGGGGYAKNTNVAVIPGSEYQVIVGNGGSAGPAGTSGGSGGNSSFGGGVVIATGGSGGGAGGNTAGTAGSGGTGSTGETIYNGGNGAGGSTTVGGGGGEGSGSTANGGNATGRTGGTGTDGGDGGNGGNNASAGNAGTAPGGAGGGAGRGNNQTGYLGGAGAPGRCVVTYNDTWAPSTSSTEYLPTWSFDSVPYNVSSSQIDMTSISGFDYTPPIYFIFTLDNSSCPADHAGNGGTSSAGQTGTSYSDTELDANKCYGYTVRSRDFVDPYNVGTASDIFYTYTSANTPGTPTLSNATISTLDLTNDSNGNPTSNPDTLYAAQVTSANPDDSAWIDKWVGAEGNRTDFETWLTDSELDTVVLQNLQQGTEYGISIKAKNEDGDETPLSSEGKGTTLEMISSATFNTSGTWAAPNGVNAIDIECWGGGGGGGGSTAGTNYGGSGGGGGSYAKVSNISTIPGNNYQVIVGKGGSGGTAGNGGSSGGNSSFETNTLIAGGGGGGGAGGNSAGSIGTGGDAENNTGDVSHSGGDGAVGADPNGGGGGEGSGSTTDGNNAVGQTGGTGTNGGNGGNGGNVNTNGSPGVVAGGAGGGAGKGGYTGGTGANGRCVITYKERVSGTLSCKVATTCSSGVVVYKLSDGDNAHAELPDQNNYSQMMCCTGVPGLSNQCSGNHQTVLRLSSKTNAHVEENTQNNYPESACLQVPDNGIIEIGYKADSCSGYDTTVGSISSITNAHIGGPDAYSTKICATGLMAGTISFSISNNNLGFGILSPHNPRFATSNGEGSENETSGHSISASTNGLGGYTIYIQGPTLTSISDPNQTITAIGEIGALPLAGIEQFGIRASASGGNGAVLSPYNDPVLYAYAASAEYSDDLAGDIDGNDIPTQYSIYYLSSVSEDTKASEYSTNIIFIVVSNF